MRVPLYTKRQRSTSRRRKNIIYKNANTFSGVFCFLSRGFTKFGRLMTHGFLVAQIEDVGLRLVNRPGSGKILLGD